MLKGTLSSLRKFLATESPIKIVKNAFYFGNRTIPPWTIGPPPPEQLPPGKLLLKTAPPPGNSHWTILTQNNCPPDNYPRPILT